MLNVTSLHLSDRGSNSKNDVNFLNKLNRLKKRIQYRRCYCFQQSSCLKVDISNLELSQITEIPV